MTTFDPTPPRLAGAVSVLAGAVGVLFATPGGFTALGLAALGLPLLALGAFRGRRAPVSLGGLFVAGGAVLGGVSGAPAPTTVAAMAAAFVAWDVGEHGVGLGEQVGAAARSRNAVLTHAAGSAGVAGVTTIATVVLFTLGPAGRPFSALLLLLVGAVVIAVALTD